VLLHCCFGIGCVWSVNVECCVSIARLVSTRKPGKHGNTGTLGVSRMRCC